MAVIGDPLAAVFDRQGCKPGILNQIPSGTGTPAQFSKDGPMAGTRVDQLAVSLVHEGATKIQSLVEVARFGEDGAVGADPQYGTQNLRRNAVRRITINNRIEPPSV